MGPTPEPLTEEESRRRNRELQEAARAAEAAGDWAGAIAALRKFKPRPEEEVSVHFRLQSLVWRQKAEHYLTQARNSAMAGRWDEAIAAADSALQFWPGLTEAEEIRARARQGRHRRRLKRILLACLLAILALLGAAWGFLQYGGTAGHGGPALQAGGPAPFSSCAVPASHELAIGWGASAAAPHDTLRRAR
jgi:tetratricopeptide (TPR) repeat protein